MAEELKQKAKDFIDRINKESGGNWLDKYYLSDLLVMFAEEAIKELKRENAELKCECRRCVHTDCPCILSDYGKDRNGICDHFKDVFDENAELKMLLDCKNCCELEESECEGCAEYGHFRCKGKVQLTEAKEIIKEYMRFEPMIGTCAFCSEEYEKTKKKAEAFINKE